MPMLHQSTPPTPNERQRPKVRRGWPKFSVDLSKPAHRFKAVILLLGMSLAAVAIGTVAVMGYTFTESSEFCGTLCHSMDPHNNQHDASAHANVECAACHVGPGVEHFVRSKIAGMRQLIATIDNSYARPIMSPVKDLRPAEEICMTCHKAQTMSNNVVKTFIEYDNDKANTKVQTTLLLRMGGKQNTTGASPGIHWHISSEVYYIAADDQRQVIPWVGVVQADGSLKEYFANDKLNTNRQEFVDTARAEGRVRKMDCVDCHNRTGHGMPTQEETVDQAISIGQLPTSLPFIRAKAVDLLKQKFETPAAADEAIDGLSGFYKQNYPSANADQLASAITQIKSLYAVANIADMKLSWDSNPNNLGHAAAPGCFRCHDNKHVNVDKAGNEVKTIGVDCNTCHTVPMSARGTDVNIDTPIVGGAPPASHADFRWTVEHRTTTVTQRQEECYQCHAEKSCNNGVCHGVSHPPRMLFMHSKIFQKNDAKACYTCHQDVLCNECHTKTFSQKTDNQEGD